MTKVLAVDDRADNLVALRAVLDALPVEVVCADSGRAALRALLDDEFGLILLDLVMPGMDGLETARHIRGRPRTRHVPIVFLTANGDGELAPQAYAVGAADMLTKPFDPWLLRAKASTLIELDQHRRELDRHRRALRRQAVRLRDAADTPPAAKTAAHGAAHDATHAATPSATLGATHDTTPGAARGATLGATHDTTPGATLGATPGKTQGAVLGETGGGGIGGAPSEARLLDVDARLREVEGLAESLHPSVPAVRPLCTQVRALREALDPLLGESAGRRS
ncbi:response regulator [Actinomadura gamaensis]|uniref:Two-component system response regulator n=1 Tax=Actinomadura gamaensis TaxID=1763541 RepID=A0ABV9U418_9ACTN